MNSFVADPRKNLEFLSGETRKIAENMQTLRKTIESLRQKYKKTLLLMIKEKRAYENSLKKNHPEGILLSKKEKLQNRKKTLQSIILALESLVKQEKESNKNLQKMIIRIKKNTIASLIAA